MVATGKIIKVEDSYGNVQAYPVLDAVFTYDEECDYIELDDDRITDEEIAEVKELLKNLGELPPVQLRNILERFKGVDSICRLVIRELRNRKANKPKRYKKQKLFYQAKGMENPDKYERRIEIDYKKMK